MRLRSNDVTRKSFNKKEKKLRQTRLVFKIVRDPFRHWISTNTKIKNAKNNIARNIKKLDENSQILDKNCEIEVVNCGQICKLKDQFKTSSILMESEITSGNCKLCSKKSIRPKRVIIPKRNEPLLGISWKEESQLTKALYASLQEVKPLKGTIADNADSSLNGIDLTCVNNQHLYKNAKRFHHLSSMQLKSSCIEIMNDRAHEIFNVKVKAQRKYAEGYQAVSSLPPPRKIVCIAPPSHIQFPEEIPSTEDFIQFLVLRGTDSIPTELEHFNFPNCLYPMATQVINKIENKPRNIYTKTYTSQSQTLLQQVNNESNKQVRNHHKSNYSKSALPHSSSNKYFFQRTSLHLKKSQNRRFFNQNKKLHHKKTNLPLFVPSLSVVSSKVVCEMKNQLPTLLSASRPNTRSLMAAKDRLRLMQAQMANK